MISSELSPQQREQAEQIFKRSIKQAFWWAFVWGSACPALTAIISRRLFHVVPNIGWFAGPNMVWFLLAPMYAIRQVRKAGLSLDRIEQRIIPKTATHFDGPSLTVYSAATRRDGWWGVAVLAVGSALLIWIQISQHAFSLPLILFFASVLSVCALQVRFRLSNPPVLRLDSRGVSSSAQHFWSRAIAWSDIQQAEWQQAFDYKGSPTLRRLIFRSRKGRCVFIVFPKAQFSDSQTYEIIAQVETHLSGDKIPTA